MVADRVATTYNGIDELLENDAARETMGRTARKRALDYFTWEGVAEGMYGRYRALCNAASVPVGTAGSA